jgi:hypothetical protein
MAIIFALEAIAVLPDTFDRSLSGGQRMSILSGNLLVLIVSLSVLAGLTSSWVVLVRGSDRVRGQRSLRHKAQIGLVLGVIAGCTMLVRIWTIKFDPYTTRSQQRFLLGTYMLLIDPALVLGIQQLYLLTRSERALEAGIRA